MKRSILILVIVAMAGKETVHGPEEGIFRKIIVIVVADDRDFEGLLIGEKAFRILFEEDVRGFLAVVFRDELFAFGLPERARGGVRVGGDVMAQTVIQQVEREFLASASEIAQDRGRGQLHRVARVVDVPHMLPALKKTFRVGADRMESGGFRLNGNRNSPRPLWRVGYG